MGAQIQAVVLLRRLPPAFGFAMHFTTPPRTGCIRHVLLWGGWFRIANSQGVEYHRLIDIQQLYRIVGLMRSEPQNVHPSIQKTAGEIPSATSMPFSIAKGSNHLLTTDDGRDLIDLLCGFGTTFLGHANPNILAALQDHWNGLWNCGRQPTQIAVEAQTLVEAEFPASHVLGGFGSTGMEAAEFALRIARVATNRPGVVGFETSMHGKSTAAAALGWPNPLVHFPDFVRLPFVPHVSEDELFEQLAGRLSTRTVSAVFVERFHGSGGGHAASADFYRQVRRLCDETGTLCVFDEIFTGFYRTGVRFCFESIGIVPDLVLIGKSMGNGFPVSAVMVDRRFPMENRMLPGTTFSGNPLAAAVVAATLREIKNLDLPRLVEVIGQTISRELEPLREAGVVIRGQGAMWFLEFPQGVNTADVVAKALAGGVLVTNVGSWIRLLPAATIPIDDLSQACRIICAACLTILKQNQIYE